MQIAQVQVGNVLYPLVEGQPLLVGVGETLKVFYGFRYRMPETSSVKVWASLYRYTLVILDRSSNAQTKRTITLERSTEWEDYTDEIDIIIGQVDPGLWGLIVELPDYGADAEDHIDNCIEVAAAPGIFEMIGPLLVLGLMMGLMAMMAPMMQGEEA